MGQGGIGRSVGGEAKPDRDQTPSQTRRVQSRTKITIYRTQEGLCRLTDAPGRVAIEAGLLAGARVGKDTNGLPCIFDPSNTLILSADEAVRLGVLQLPIAEN